MQGSGVSIITALAATGHLFSEHPGMNGPQLRRVGPVQYAIHWMYGYFEPQLLRLMDDVMARDWIMNTALGKLILDILVKANAGLPHGVAVTTPAAERLIDFITETEGPKGARLAVGPCVCQKALDKWAEPCMKDIVVLYGADIYYHLDMGYELISGEETKEILRECHAAGLVHSVEFCMQSGKWIFVICNCDAEICVLTRIHKHTGQFIYHGPEIAVHDPGQCQGVSKCGKCLQRCIFDANTTDGEIVSLDATKCHGCGLCIATCSGNAREMAERPDYEHGHILPEQILLS